jgi:hypothetical protein
MDKPDWEQIYVAGESFRIPATQPVTVTKSQLQDNLIRAGGRLPEVCGTC